LPSPEVMRMYNHIVPKGFEFQLINFEDTVETGENIRGYFYINSTPTAEVLGLVQKVIIAAKALGFTTVSRKVGLNQILYTWYKSDMGKSYRLELWQNLRQDGLSELALSLEEYVTKPKGI